MVLDRHELEAAQKFLEQAAIENLVRSELHPLLCDNWTHNITVTPSYFISLTHTHTPRNVCWVSEKTHRFLVFPWSHFMRMTSSRCNIIDIKVFSFYSMHQCPEMSYWSKTQWVNQWLLNTHICALIKCKQVLHSDITVTLIGCHVWWRVKVWWRVECHVHITNWCFFHNKCLRGRSRKQCLFLKPMTTCFTSSLPSYPTAVLHKNTCEEHCFSMEVYAVHMASLNASRVILLWLWREMLGM